LVLGELVPIPILPWLLTKRRDVRLASPPTEVLMSKVPPLRMLRVAAGLVPVGIERAKLPEMVAVLVEDEIPVKAKAAELVAEPPMVRSRVELLG